MHYSQCLELDLYLPATLLIGNVSELICVLVVVSITALFFLCDCFLSLASLFPAFVR